MALTPRPYASRMCLQKGLREIHFAELLEFFEADLFDARTGNGRLLFLSPAALQGRSGIDVIALADSWDEAARTVTEEVPARLAELVARPRPTARRSYSA